MLPTDEERTISQGFDWLVSFKREFLEREQT